MSVSSPTPLAEDLDRRTKMLILAATMLTLFVAAIDQTVVATSLPRIVSDLGGFDQFTWVFTAYMLTSTVGAPVWGKLSDIWGRKIFMMMGLVIFMVSSATCGLSQNMLELIIWRAVQGIGAGMIMSSSFTMIGDLFSPAERARYQGLFSAVFGLASVTGPFIGGYLTDNISWRWTFYINIPIGLIALPVLLFVLPTFRHGRTGRIDFLGVFTLTAGVTPLLLALVWGGETYPWGSVQIVGCFALAAIMITAFVFNESRAADPIMPLSLFRDSTYVIVSAVTFLTGLAMFGATVFVPLFVQGVIGTSATSSGAVTAPMMIGMVTSSTLIGNLVSRTGRYKLPSLLGALVMAAGMFLLSTMDASTTQLMATAFMIILGFGVGTVMPTMTVVAQNAAPIRMLGVVTSNLQFYRSIGGTIGVTIMGALMNNQLGGKLPPLDPRLEQLPGPVIERLRDPQTLVNPETQASLRDSFASIDGGSQLLATSLEQLRLALSDSLHLTFMLATAVMMIGFVLLFFLRETPLRSKDTSPGRPLPEEGAATPAPGRPAAMPEGAVPATVRAGALRAPRRRGPAR